MGFPFVRHCHSRVLARLAGASHSVRPDEPGHAGNCGMADRHASGGGLVCRCYAGTGLWNDDSTIVLGEAGITSGGYRNPNYTDHRACALGYTLVRLWLGGEDGHFLCGRYFPNYNGDLLDRKTLV